MLSQKRKKGYRIRKDNIQNERGYFTSAVLIKNYRKEIGNLGFAFSPMVQANLETLGFHLLPPSTLLDILALVLRFFYKRIL